MFPSTDFNQLCHRRSELHRAGAIAEAIPLQAEILRRLETQGKSARDIANAHNYLSVLYTKNGDYLSAEFHAHRALNLHEGGTTPKDRDALACYSMTMARILCLLGNREEAIHHAEIALREWVSVHQPSTDFLIARQNEVSSMKTGTWTNPLTLS